MTDAHVSNNDQMADCLQGLRVIDLTRNLPGPFVTRLLAGMGRHDTWAQRPCSCDKIGRCSLKCRL